MSEYMFVMWERRFKTYEERRFFRRYGSANLLVTWKKKKITLVLGIENFQVKLTTSGDNGPRPEKGKKY